MEEQRENNDELKSKTSRSPRTCFINQCSFTFTFISIQFICRAHFHKLQICLRVLYIPDLWPLTTPKQPGEKGQNPSGEEAEEDPSAGRTDAMRHCLNDYSSMSFCFRTVDSALLWWLTYLCLYSQPVEQAPADQPTSRPADLGGEHQDDEWSRLGK